MRVNIKGNGPLLKKLVEVFSKNFNRNSINELLLFEFGQELTEYIDPTGLNDETVMIKLILELEKRNTSFELLKAAVKEHPDDPELTEILHEVGSGTSLAGTDLYEARCLFGTIPMLARDRLRRELRNLSNGARRVLVIEGPHNSGKSYSTQLIRYIAEQSESTNIVFCDLENLAVEGEISEITGFFLGNEIMRQMGLEPAERGNEQESRWAAKRYPTDLKNTLKDPEKKYWIIIDHFDKALLNQGVHDLIEALSKRIEVDMGNLRMVLLSYDNFEILDRQLNIQPGHEIIRQFQKNDLQEELTKFFQFVFDERKSRKGLPYEKSDLDKAIENVWAGISTTEVRWLRSLSRALDREADRIRFEGV